MAMHFLYPYYFPPDCLAECSSPGSVDDAVDYWIDRIDAFDGIPPEDIRDCLRGYGAWDDEELQDDGQNLRRLLWIVACDFRDGSDVFCVE